MSNLKTGTKFNVGLRALAKPLEGTTVHLQLNTGEKLQVKILAVEEQHAEVMVVETDTKLPR